MPQGKFSQPRPHRDEERQIEEAFRQVTEKNTSQKRQRKPIDPAPLFHDRKEETIFLPEEQRRIREAAMQEMARLEEEAAMQAEPPIEDQISAQIERDYLDIPTVPEPNRPVSVPPEEDWDTAEYEEEDYEEEPETFPERAMAFFSRHKTGILAAMFCAALAMILGVVGIFTAGLRTGTEEPILNNVMVAGVNVGGMSKKEAVSAVKLATSRTYTRQDMVIRIAGTEIRLSPEDTQASLDVKAAVEAAWAYGHTGTQAEMDAAHRQSLSGIHTVGLLPYLNLDLTFIQDTLNAYASNTENTLTQVSYGLEGDYPKLNADQFNPDSAQTLVLTMGTPGITFDTQTVYHQVLDAYSLHEFEVTVSEVTTAVLPEPVDLQAIYEEFYIAPVDSRINPQTLEVIPGFYGYEFDLAAAQRQVDAAQYADVLRIPMVFIEPKLIDADTLFGDVLGEYSTNVNGNSALMNNVRLACQALNGITIAPGETFSFLNAIGEPSTKKGYQLSVSDFEEEVLGWGISQAATTLYCSALVADLEIVSRTAHPHHVPFAEYGFDADVSWGGPDLKLRNNGNYPVQIQTSVSGSAVIVQILGTDDRDYFVKLEHQVTDVHDPKMEFAYFDYDNEEGYLDGEIIQEGITGYTVKSYKLKYSSTTGKLLSRDFEATTRYNTVNCVIAQVSPPETTVPETTVPETTVPETTVPETTVPETTVPAEAEAAPAGSGEADIPPEPETE